MRAIFLSDAHLIDRHEAAYRAVMRFLEGLEGPRRVSGSGGRQVPGEGAGRCDALFLAGDFFDFWFGREGRIFPDFLPVIERLTALRDQGVRIGLCEGNHDFFLEDYFTDVLGMEVFPDWAELDLDGKRILLTHGDIIDPPDSGAALVRKILRSRFLFRLQRILPAPFVWRAARLTSLTSRRFSGEMENRIVDSMRRFALNKFGEGYDAVICGHSHRPVIEIHETAGRARTFMTLGDWIRHCSYGVFEDGSFSLSFFRP
ncbi:MAG TPA: UDP-2,3-diacylglucosamine diphosphatase [Syntrophales bacterium]|nr:UDP-2,3-diacylglucosamine diphosphatase [Syntrophales bacterium]